MTRYKTREDLGATQALLADIPQSHVVFSILEE